MKPTRGLPGGALHGDAGPHQGDDRPSPTAGAATSTTRAPRRASSTRSTAARTGSLGRAPEEVMLDLNALAEGQKFLSLGAYTVSDDGDLLAYSTDNTGFREYTLYVKDLAHGRAAARPRSRRWRRWPGRPTAGRCSTSTEDEAKRAYRLYRHGWARPPTTTSSTRRRTSCSGSACGRSRSRDLLFCASRSFTTTETRYLRRRRPPGAWRMLLRRASTTTSTTSTTAATSSTSAPTTAAANFRLVTRARRRPAPGELEGAGPPPRGRDARGASTSSRTTTCCSSARTGSPALRVDGPARRASAHHVEFPEPAYDREPGGQPRVRHAASSASATSRCVTPPSVFDYDMDERTAPRCSSRRRCWAATTARATRRSGSTPTAGRRHAGPDLARVPQGHAARRHEPRCCSTGYGAYGIAYPVTFSSNRLSLLDRGVSSPSPTSAAAASWASAWHDRAAC